MTQRSSHTWARRLRARTGMSMIELVVAMTLLAIALTSLARMSVLVSSRGRTNDVVAQRAAAMQQAVSWLGGIPFSRIDSVTTGTHSFTAGSFAYSRTITITTASNIRNINIVITPTADATKKDSVTFTRANPPSDPLCSGC
jgi:prepilin-type N-terminal cleavage/methylation domain-containing protein